MALVSSLYWEYIYVNNCSVSFKGDSQNDNFVYVTLCARLVFPVFGCGSNLA